MRILFITKQIISMAELTDIKVLLVDDEHDVLEFLGYNLRKEGFVVYTASNSREALRIAREQLPNLVLLDVMMPELDGMETCIALRKIPVLSEMIIVFLTARGEDYSQIAGFEAGADDYVTKPVKPKVLVSRIKALLRRQVLPVKPDIIQLGDLSIDRERYLVIRGKDEISLPRKEFELLALLASKPDKVFTREEIFSHVWGNDVIVGERTIDVHIRKIREKLEIPNIKTIKGIGYKYETNALP